MQQRLLFLLLSFLISFLASAETKYDFIVDAKGSGNFTSVQSAINAVPDFRKVATIIYIKNGSYKEKIVLPKSKQKVILVGEDKENTIITNDDFAQKKNSFGEEMGTTGSSGFFVFGDDFRADNITFENSAGPVGQAVAVRVSGDRAIFNNCRFLGNQDTLYPQGKASRQYYKDCYIEGTVDFIFGWATCVFDNCTIYCKSKGYVTAASTEETSKYGFVFRNCHITGNAEANSFYLGRPWRPHSNVVFLNCKLDKIIKAEGWNNWGKESNEKTAFYAEYKNYGEGAETSKRVAWSHQLNDSESEEYTLEKIFAADVAIPHFNSNWIPKL